MDAKKYIDYWHELRSGAAVPQRADFNPMHMKKLLPFMLVLECCEQGKLQKRLSGSFLDSFLNIHGSNQSQVINWPLSLKQHAAWKNLLTTLLTSKIAGVTFEANVMIKNTFFDTLSGAFLPFHCENKNVQLIGGIWPNEPNTRLYLNTPLKTLHFIETKISIIPTPDGVSRRDIRLETFEYFKMRDELIALAS